MKCYASPIPQELLNEEYWYYMDLYMKTFGKIFPNMCMHGEYVIKGIKECLETGEAYKGDLPPGVDI